MRPSGARFHLRPFGKGADLFVFDSGDLSAGPEYINDFESGVDRLDLGEGVQSETLSDGRVRVFIPAAPVEPADPVEQTGDNRDNYLRGGAGADTLSGGHGADSLYGGPGADVFRFNPGDVDDGDEYINDFESGVDRLDLVSGLASETLSDGRVRVYKAPAVGFGAFGFESDAAPFGFEIDGDGGGGLI